MRENKMSKKYTNAAYEVAKKIINQYRKQEERIAIKYLKKFQDCVNEIYNDMNMELYHGFYTEFPEGYDMSWNDNFVSEQVYNKKLEKTRRNLQEHEKFDFVSRKETTGREENKTTKIIIKGTVPKEPTPIWDSSVTDNLEDWIIKGKISPLPPKGYWWNEEYWKSIHYPPVPFYDIIENSAKFQKIVDEYYDECSKALKEIYDKQLIVYTNRVIGGLKSLKKSR